MLLLTDPTRCWLHCCFAIKCGDQVCCIPPANGYYCWSRPWYYWSHRCFCGSSDDGKAFCAIFIFSIPAYMSAYLTCAVLSPLPVAIHSLPFQHYHRLPYRLTQVIQLMTKTGGWPQWWVLLVGDQGSGWVWCVSCLACDSRAPVGTTASSAVTSTQAETTEVVPIKSTFGGR